MKNIFSIVTLAIFFGMATAHAQGSETKLKDQNSERQFSTIFSDPLSGPVSFANFTYSKESNKIPKEFALQYATVLSLNDKRYNKDEKTDTLKLSPVLSKRISSDSTTANFLGYPLKGLTTQMLTFNEGTIIGDTVLVYRFK